MDYKRKYFAAFLLLLWLITLALMIQNYINYPPLEPADPLYDRLNNIEGSIYKYGALSLAELIWGVAWSFYFFTLPLYLRALVIVLSIGLVAWGFVDAMFSGGVAATHALWFTMEMVIVFFFVIFKLLKSGKSVK